MPVTMRLGDVELVFPDGSFAELGDPFTLDGGLRLLTKTLIEKGHGEPGGGLLGGDYGYGVNFENEVFAFHRYCWCDREDCPWCGGCTCPEDAFHYLVDGKEVTYQDWQKFFDDYAGAHEFEMSEEKHRAWSKRADEANARRDTQQDKVCDYCRGVVRDHGQEPGRPAPNFWHRPSGFKVWWYKYIGRDMETVGPKKRWAETLGQCLASIREVTAEERAQRDQERQEAIEAYERERAEQKAAGIPDPIVETYPRWVADITVYDVEAKNLFAFCPVTDDGVVVGMTYLSTEPPIGAEFVGPFHHDGREAASEWEERYPEEAAYLKSLGEVKH